MLDKVQKKKSLTDEEFNYLKKKKFIEGRKNHIFLSFKIVKHSNNDYLKAEYIANKSFDDQHFKDIIIEYLKKYGKAKRKSLDSLIIPKLSAALSDEQKKQKVTNFLSSLRMDGKIKCLPGYFWETL
jgi:ATP-dependent DNA helicase RecG